jgi:hypothetical protein
LNAHKPWKRLCCRKCYIRSIETRVDQRAAPKRRLSGNHFGAIGTLDISRERRFDVAEYFRAGEFAARQNARVSACRTISRSPTGSANFCSPITPPGKPPKM